MSGEQQLVEAAAAVARRLDSKQALPRTWPGTVTGYTAATRVAQVRLDGDTVSVGAVNALPVAPVSTGRVLVLLMPPSGAFVVGVLDSSVTITGGSGLVATDSPTITGLWTFSQDISYPLGDLDAGGYLMAPGVI